MLSCKKNILTLILFMALSHAQSQSSKPNIILFLVDDMGWQDCSVPFYKEATKWNQLYRTPNMEKLAASGVKFTHAYANQNCTPTRVSILTGMNVVNHGVSTWTFDQNKSMDDEPSQLFSSPQWNMNGLSTVAGIENTVVATTLPQLLHQAGYVSILAGKAHFGANGTPGADPLNLGFDVNIAGSGAGQPGTYLGETDFGNNATPKNIRAVPGMEEFWHKDIFLTEALTQKALRKVDSIRNKKQQPFFLYLSQFAVHTPYQPDKRFIQKYYQLGLDSTEAKYAALVEGMDKSLGDVMQYLKDKQLTQNTVIIFMSDNGGLTDVARGGIRNTHNSPLRSGKTSGYEGGLRVPMIINWPGQTKNGTVNHANVIAEDVFTTISSIAGIEKANTIQTIDGKNILPLFANEHLNDERVFTWHHPHPASGRSKDVVAFSAIRIGKWKLLYLHFTQTFELYDTDADISEQFDLSKKEPDRVKTMALLLGSILKKGHAPMPIKKSSNTAIAYPDELFGK